MIATTLVCISLMLSNINCQQIPQGQLFPGPSQVLQEPFREEGFQYDPWNLRRRLGAENGLLASPEYTGSLPRLSTSQLTPRQELFNIGESASNLNGPNMPYPSLIGPNLRMNPMSNGNVASASNLREIVEQSQPQPFPRSIIESQRHLIPNFSQNLELPKSLLTSAALPRFSQALDVPSTPQTSQFTSRFSQILQNHFPTLTQSSSPTLKAPTPSPVSPSLQSPRSIPSPLTLTDTMPLEYSQVDAMTDTFDVAEPRFKSSVGCLDLTVTPYGTISETPLPDPSVAIPRSPFFPVASPVSALAPPLSPLLPSASPALAGSNFLRKVPVPPPFI